MKSYLHMRLLLPVLLLLVTNSGRAQSTPNGDFESWTTGVFDIPQYYLQTSNPSTFFKCKSAANCVKVADSYHGSYAIKLTTTLAGIDTCFGYFLNANPNGDPTTWKGGVPYNQKPTGIRGYYKSAIPATDSGTIITIFKAAGTVIGVDVFKLYGTHSTYTPFNFTFSSPLAINPDTVIFAAASSDVFNNFAINGSMLQLDSISFAGVASQPAQFNGDFELWNTQTLKSLNNWYQQGDDQGNGVLQTTDVHSGNYAVEIKNLLSTNNAGTTYSQPSSISTGYYNCVSGICYQQGGYPFLNVKDTLSFYYKYAPALTSDSAQVTMAFKKNKVIFDYRGMQLGGSPSYQYVQVPFQLAQAPDSVIIQFNSGLYTNSTINYAGSDLKVDDLKFKSQSVATGLQDLINESHTKVFPNPGKGIFNFTSAIKITDVEVTNLYGQRVYTTIADGMQITIDLTAQPKGVYIYTLRNKSKITARGKIVIQ
ncbi:MAG: T9SS type A sorting domain-containing protein [Sphingobacteriales bacterium]|nr:T9SS type A sorting domain-containing protein [Sphingobacteriales bacterium]MBI3718946.1 T9SS type A sorting domain-containing protein [Sphingobacteriales bacterium]